MSRCEVQDGGKGWMMASSLSCAGGPGGSGLSVSLSAGAVSAVKSAGSPRRVKLEFPPPPPYPPPQKLEQRQGGLYRPSLEPCVYHEYDCHEASPSRLHSPYVIEYNYSRQTPQQQYLLLQQQKQQQQAKQQDPRKRHTYVTRYGTEENIYEEIAEIG